MEWWTEFRLYALSTVVILCWKWRCEFLLDLLLYQAWCFCEPWLWHAYVSQEVLLAGGCLLYSFQRVAQLAVCCWPQDNMRLKRPVLYVKTTCIYPKYDVGNRPTLFVPLALDMFDGYLHEAWLGSDFDYFKSDRLVVSFLRGVFDQDGDGHITLEAVT